MSPVVGIRLERPPQTKDELHLFCKVVFGVSIPRQPICTGHVAPFDVFAAAYFATEPVIVAKSSRGFGGKSQLLALLGLVEAVTLGADVAILGGSGEQSNRVIAHMKEMWLHEGAPTHMQIKDPTKSHIGLTNGGLITAQLASQRSVRGGHPSRLRIDEGDELALELLDAAMGQPMFDRRNNIVANTLIASTQQYPDGTMTECMRRCAQREGWHYMTWCYRESMGPGGWLTEDEVDRKKLEVSEQMWAVEYENQEPNPEGRAIVPEAVESMFDADLGMVDGKQNIYYEFEAPVEEGRYAHGADWAKSGDWTVIVTIRTDIEPAKVVAFERTGRVPWPKMVKKLDERMDRYPGTASHDATGSGGVVADLLQHMAEDYVLTGRKRDDLLSDYISACENDRIRSPRIMYAYNEHKFASNNDIYGSGHLPDSICAFAMAWRAKNLRHRMRAYVL